MGGIFLSYARENTDDATKIRDGLQSLGFKVWFDQKDLLATDNISDAIDKQISKVDAVLVLWSAAARESVWVRGEALSGLSSNKYVGAQLDTVVPPVPFNAKNAAGLSDWTGSLDHPGWDLLVRSLAPVSGAQTAQIIAALERAQVAERVSVASNAASQQGALPLDDVPTEELLEEHAYGDVDALLAEAESILRGEGKIDLTVAITQAALNYEMLRDAAFVVDRREPTISHRRDCPTVSSIQAALDQARDGDLIAVMPGRFEENLKIRKSVRVVGLGLGNDRPLLAAKNADFAIDFMASARLENLAIETKHRKAAIYCSDHQPVLVRCIVSRFSRSTAREDGAIYVAGKANPIVIATSIASADTPGLYFVTGCGGTFLGGSVTSYRSSGVVCRGQPKFRSCVIEAIGGPAVDVLGKGFPTFDDCDISGKGASVIKVVEQARPKIRDSRVTAVRQFAFDFDGDCAGSYERNIVRVEREPEAGIAKSSERGFWGFKSKAKQDELVRAAVDQRAVSMRSRGRPLFVLNTMTDGKELAIPAAQ